MSASDHPVETPSDDGVDDLLDGYFAGDLDEAGTARLGAWLLERPAHRQRLLVESAWRAELRATLACDVVPRASGRPIRAARWRWFRPAVAAAALMAVGMILAALRAPVVSQGSVATARIASVSAPAWLVHGSDRRDAVVGDRLMSGSRLVTGEGGGATASADDGTVLEMGGNADLSWLGAHEGQRWRLDAGTIDARFSIQPTGKPAKIATAHAIVEVVGTMFTLATDRTSTRLAMREGRVEIVAADHAARLSCKAGESAIADATGARLDVLATSPFSGFSLVDADADRALAGYDPMPDGTIVKLSALPTRSITIMVRLAEGAAAPASARLLLDGHLHRIERPPYSMMGNRFLDAARSVPDFRSWKPPLGRPVRIEAVPCSDPVGAKPSGPPVAATFRFEP